MTVSTDTTAALARIEQLAGRSRTLFAPSVLQEAAALLADMWATGERHGVTAEDWAWATSLPDGSLQVTAHRCNRAPKPKRTASDVRALRQALIAALAELGLGAHIGRAVILDRCPATPRWGLDGRAPLAVGIWTDSGWDLGLDGLSASPVISITAPATEAGATEVAAIVAAIIRGELPDPFRRD